ncbi:SAM-dependent methyltransferase [Paenibacillus rhizovicinus]|uniref:SAM-dependent methyltransferase n=1 Tax=Paenibacillus rhizovicinus TaxID=2704463 RepID=A0A6C0NW20_9BACL|nr:SAM-dependent methyltransferase [Paenibacillus rhizovicinus]QHW30395.1 SAM-dependent methyltransferase [Paenibacillus rhizovicinus]
MGNTKRLASAIGDAIKLSDRSGWVDSTSPASGERYAAITFHDYMAMCLYDEIDGYYKSGPVRVGKSGDFYTSSGIGSIMGIKLAGYAAKLAAGQARAVTIMEWGAGTGALANQMLTALEESDGGDGPPWLADAHYVLVDSNPVHLDEARSTLAGRAMGDAGLAPALSFMQPEEAEAYLREVGNERFAIVIGNELLDAFPVHRVVQREGALWELGVTTSNAISAAADFRYVHMPLSDERIPAVLERDGIQLREGQIFEVNLNAEQWIVKLARFIHQGSLVLIDYGHEALELAAPHRMRGSLLCYKDHVARDEPFLEPGNQDMTAHVNFTSCRAAGTAAGWSLRYYATQKQFLVDEGLLSELTGHDGTNPFGEAAKRNRAIRQLLLSDAMSETFKVLVLDKS